MIRLILNTTKLLMRKKSYIISGVIIPVFIIIFFSFEFGGQYKYKIGIVDKDNSYSSNQIIESIDELEDIQSVKIKEKDYKLLLITQQIEVAVIIDKNFEQLRFRYRLRSRQNGKHPFHCSGSHRKV